MKSFPLALVLLLLMPTMGPAPAADSIDRAEEPILFGVIPRYNPMLMYRIYQPLVDYLTEATPYRFELKLSRDYGEAVEFLRKGTTQVAFLGDLTFAKACEGFDVLPIAKPLSSSGDPFYRSIVVVREDSPIRSLKDLEGKSFAFGDLHSSSGNLVPRYLLFEHGITVFDLKFYDHLSTHAAVAKAVLKGKFDAGAVKDSVASSYRKQGLRFLAVSDPIPSVPIVVRKDAPPDLVKALTDALLALDPEEHDLMDEWDQEFRYGFMAAHTDDYQSIFQMLAAIPGGCGIQCH
jgi:phosphonate transport system substrate-binding protein